MIEIITPGFYSSVQDKGRFGYRSAGVGCCGAMDSQALAIGNAALGNTPDAAAIEFTLGGFEIEAKSDITICLAGAPVDAQVDGKPIFRWWLQTVLKGQRLKAGRCQSGMRVYLCVLGGIEVPLVLGSRSTDLKGQFGGVEGRLLKRGDQLSIGTNPKGGNATSIGISPRGFPDLWRDLNETPTLRFVPASEWGDLDANNQAEFLTSDWQITPASNRVGYRLSGPELRPETPREMLSHGILPGTIQLPPSGQPVVQLMDANTAGGYPKLGKIIDADLPVLAQIPLGETIRFQSCTIEEATTAQDRQHLQTESIRRLMTMAHGRCQREIN
ncbi:biotin-dependent carboxyltransferase family protein [Granulosicoccus antarcticus]|uniref:KipI antagonist n=1 Tax=Granulosicoccus antarcticus IMCC3135 TaxID=1192854 RepID=A0A2Z2NL91_9GAMM|nr:biotin-dependent carboxyltransferase family protein [Granulosicoccus antarcticus]ASJ71919.1 KipI antagonist [Granulosicoccus antarcticus IMCC3135]